MRKVLISAFVLLLVAAVGAFGSGQQGAEEAEGPSEPEVEGPTIPEVSLEECRGGPQNQYVSEERKAFLETKPYEGLTIDILGNKGTITNTYSERYVEEWENLTGADVNLVLVPLPNYHSKAFTDLLTGRGEFDAFHVPAWFYGDFFEGKRYLRPIGEYWNDPKMPYWCPATIAPAIDQLLKWNGRYYGAPLDNDGQVLYYRDDILKNEDYQADFEEEYGYTYSVPPKNYQEVLDIAEFYNGWDWDEDGEEDYGFTGHFKVGGQGMFHYMTWSAPYIVSPNNPYYWFDPDTMEPLVNSEGHLRALEDLQKLVDSGPRAMLAWTLGEAWDLFLRGDAVITFTWGDLGALAQDEDESRVRGKVGASILPGVTETYNPIAGEWDEWDDPNQVGNNIGGSWHGTISALASDEEAQAAYDFFAYMAQADNNWWYSLRGWTGVDIGRSFTFLEEDGGEATLSDYTEQGWSEHDIRELSKAYHDSFYADRSFNLLRIPGANEYIRAVDVVISEVLSGKRDAEEALDNLVDRFNDITERHGRESQKQYYQEMLKK